jgi:hypothetical protein
VSLVCNASGSEEQGLFIVGKAKRPRGFSKSFQPNRDVGIRYANNKSAWITSQEYSRWVADWNAECSHHDRKIIRLVDNAPTHMVNGHDVEQEDGLKVINLTHIKLVFLPANVTSIAQPLDQGIIACAKAHYRGRLVMFLLDEANAPGHANKSLKKLAPNFYQMMCWINSAWLEDVLQDCIVNCWWNAGILPDAHERRGREGRREQVGEMGEGELDVAEGGSDSQEKVVSFDATLVNEMPHQDAVVQLAEALETLREHLHTHDMPESDELVNADECVDLEGEQEVCAVESVEEIVTMVTTDHTNAVDSDEDEEDEWKHPTLNAEQAFERARLLTEFIFAYPRYVSGKVLHCVDEIASGCSSMSAKNKKQASLKDLWGL